MIESAPSIHHSVANARPLVTVMTRLRTVNIGNEALSNELLRIVATSFPDQRVQAMERAPRFLARYLVRDLPRNIDRALECFERWAMELEALGRAAKPIDFSDRSSPAVKLVLESTTSPWRARVKNRLQLRRYAARLGLYDQEFGERLVAHRQAQIAILNPAGELNWKSVDPVLRMLLELRAAQRLGCRAGMVNFSFEIADPFLVDLYAAILAKFDFLSVRDRPSQKILVAAGIRAECVPVIGDLVHLTEPESEERGAELARRFGLTHDSIALVVMGKLGGSQTSVSIEDWSRLARQLAALSKDKEVVILSNELSSDLPYGLELEKRAPARMIKEQFSYRDYAALLKHLRLLVSNRLHSSILALVSGTPVVGIEPSTHKIIGAMDELGYPLPVTAVTEPDWVEKTVSTAVRALNDEVSLRALIPGLVQVRAASIRSAFDRLLPEPVRSFI